MDPALLTRIYSGLLGFPNIQILRSVGSWDGGTVITLMLENPQPLVGLLLGISEVHIIIESEARGADGNRIDAAGELMVPGNKIDISLRA